MCSSGGTSCMNRSNLESTFHNSFAGSYGAMRSIVSFTES
jgi:hypothetical protein